MFLGPLYLSATILKNTSQLKFIVSIGATFDASPTRQSFSTNLKTMLCNITHAEFGHPQAAYMGVFILS
jgi:hypothetical protein